MMSICLTIPTARGLQTDDGDTISEIETETMIDTIAGTTLSLLEIETVTSDDGRIETGTVPLKKLPIKT